MNSPNGKDPMCFKWPCSENTIIFIRQSIELFAQDCLMVDIKCKVSSIVKSGKLETFEQAQSLVNSFNQMARRTNEMVNVPIPFATPAFLKHIIECCIDYVDVSSIKKPLPAFSEKTYSEISYELMGNVCQRMDCDTESVYIDMGAGIGQTVFQMAGTRDLKKCIGIEIRHDLFETVIKIGNAFVELMAWFGKFHSEFELVEGDITSEGFIHFAFNVGTL